MAGSGARRYAEALLDLATLERAVSAYRQSLEGLAAAFGRDVIRALRDARVPLEQRRLAIEAAAKGEPRPIRAVLEILLRHDRLALLPEIARAFGELVDRREGIAKARITTPVEIRAAERDELVRRLEQASGRKIRATFAIDPTLIGGAKVQVGDRLIDASLKTQLAELAEQMARS